MDKASSLAALDARHLWHPFTQARTAGDPVLITAAKGAHLTGADGTTYLDLVSSWWVNLHGHAHPRIAGAIAKQAARLEHVMFAGFTHEPAIELARRLTALLPAPLSRVFYSDDGSTSVEVALKIAYQYWRNSGVPGRTRFIAFEGGYHGDTLGAMSAGRSSGFYVPFEGLMCPVDIVPFPATWQGDIHVEAREAAALDALGRLLDANARSYAAAIIEPLVQGASGMRFCRPEFLRAVAARLAGANVILIFDEVMTGFGRTGAMFACEKAGVTPDILCLSKGITGGFLPLAATITSGRIYEAFLGDGIEAAFLHGHSYTANPLGCAAALASLDLFKEEATLSRIAEIERFYHERLRTLSAKPNAERARALGSIAAFEVKSSDSRYGSAVSAQIRSLAMEQGLLLRPLGNAVYLMPPYCISDAELEQAFDAIARIIDQV